MPVPIHAPANRHEEAVRVYRALFRGEPSPALLERYLAASEEMDRRADPGERATCARWLARVDDVEALEVACRYTRRLPLLSRKVHLMVYMAETLPDYQGEFVSERTSLGAGVTALVVGAFRTALKLAKGLVLIARLRHV
jgi:hypothetical protein